ncbi:MAG TPA: 30S ribosomal protein S2 [Candidatus Woesebacteria bacterium]|nr:30S ribosomal protein S2 [Candidatus Woesebacteria bacterium]
MATKKAEEKKVVTTTKKEVKKTVKKEVVKKEAAPKKVKEVKVEVKTPKTEVTVEDLFEAGAHFGHVVKKWNPKMKKYLWGEKNGIHIFDLELTVAGLNEACKALTKAALEGKRIVLIGTKRQAKAMLEQEAKRVGVPYITQRWMGGLITNWKQVKLTLDRLNSLKLKREQGQLKKFTKKEQVLFDKEIARLERVVGGIASLKDSPEVVVVVDTHKEKLAVKEASSRGAMVVGLVDSNANPDQVDHVIPMNDDSAKALEIVIGAFGKALETGLKERKDLTPVSTNDK